MNTFFVLVVVCGIYFVSAEKCTTNADCTQTQCGTGTIVCQHPDGSGILPDNGLCTCEDSAAECVYAQDCYGDNAPNLSCPDEARHCYDAKCICDRFPVGRRAIPL